MFRCFSRLVIIVQQGFPYIIGMIGRRSSICFLALDGAHVFI
jgi:hypothetical protein